MTIYLYSSIRKWKYISISLDNSKTKKLYGYEVWTLKVNAVHRMKAFKMWYYRQMLSILWTVEKSNAKCSKKLVIPFILYFAFYIINCSLVFYAILQQFFLILLSIFLLCNISVLIEIKFHSSHLFYALVQFRNMLCLEDICGGGVCVCVCLRKAPYKLPNIM